MAKPLNAAQANGMHNIEGAIVVALNARGVDLRAHSFFWSSALSAIEHAEVQQLALHLRDGRIIIHRFSIDEIDRASGGITDLAMLRRLQSIAQTVSPGAIHH